MDIGKTLYEADVAKKPFYHDGTLRQQFDLLPKWCRDWWDKMATREICEKERAAK